jgi:hypothetical protein
MQNDTCCIDLIVNENTLPYIIVKDCPKCFQKLIQQCGVELLRPSLDIIVRARAINCAYVYKIYFSITSSDLIRLAGLVEELAPNGELDSKLLEIIKIIVQ